MQLLLRSPGNGSALIRMRAQLERSLRSAPRDQHGAGETSASDRNAGSAAFSADCHRTVGASNLVFSILLCMIERLRPAHCHNRVAAVAPTEAM
jgi:hypothetical protein